MQRNQIKVFVVSVGLLLGYFALTNHVNLYPWNNLSAAGPQLHSTLAGIVPFTVCVALVLGWRRIGVWVSVVWSTVWLLLQLRQWWLPYLFGPTTLHSNFDWYFSNGYIETTSFLPASIGPVPDAQHIVLQTLSVVVVVFAIRLLLVENQRNENEDA